MQHTNSFIISFPLISFTYFFLILHMLTISYVDDNNNSSARATESSLLIVYTPVLHLYTRIYEAFVYVSKCSCLMKEKAVPLHIQAIIK